LRCSKTTNGTKLGLGKFKNIDWIEWHGKRLELGRYVTTYTLAKVTFSGRDLYEKKEEQRVVCSFAGDDLAYAKLEDE
jgi:hypothetical protein